jgi:hypothetical protein
MICEICHEGTHFFGATCDPANLVSIVKDLREKLRIAGLELTATKKLEGENVISMVSLISNRNQRPRVDVQLGDLHMQMDAEDAVDVGRKLIECASGAYADAYLYHFAIEEVGSDVQGAIAMIRGFREYREKLEIELKEEHDQSK